MNEISIIVIFSFLIRLPFLLIETSDEWTTWWIIKQQKGKKLHYDLSDSLIEGNMPFPKLQYFLVSRFPERYWGIVGNSTNMIYEVFSVIITYILADLLFSLMHIAASNLMMSPAAWVALLYSVTPIMLPVTGRLKGIKARTLGTLLSLIYFLSFGAGYITENGFFYLGCIISGILIIISSIFALQNIAFVSLFLSLLFFDWIPIVVFIITLIISLAIPIFGVKKILFQKFNHFKWYVRNYAGTTAEGRNVIKDMLLLPVYLLKSPPKFLDQVFKRNTLIIALYSIPTLFILLYWSCTDNNLFTVFFSNHILHYVAAIITSSIIIFILTSLKPFLFLGQAERYFEYSSPFVCFLFIYSLIKIEASTFLLIFLFLFQMSIILITLIYSMYNNFVGALKSPLTSKEMETLVEYIKKLDGSIRILTIPAKFSMVLSYHVNNFQTRFYYIFVNPSKGKGFDYMNDDLVAHRFPRTDIEHFKNKYGINTIVIYKKALVTAQKRGLFYKFANENPVFENQEYAVYRI